VIGIHQPRRLPIADCLLPLPSILDRCRYGPRFGYEFSCFVDDRCSAGFVGEQGSVYQHVAEACAGGGLGEDGGDFQVAGEVLVGDVCEVGAEGCECDAEVERAHRDVEGMLDGGGEVAGALGVVGGEALEGVEVGVGVGVFVAEG